MASVEAETNELASQLPARLRLAEPLAGSAELRVILFFYLMQAKILWFAYPRR